MAYRELYSAGAALRGSGGFLFSAGGLKTAKRNCVPAYKTDLNIQ